MCKCMYCISFASATCTYASQPNTSKQFPLVRCNIFLHEYNQQLQKNKIIKKQQAYYVQKFHINRVDDVQPCALVCCNGTFGLNSSGAFFSERVKLNKPKACAPRYCTWRSQAYRGFVVQILYPYGNIVASLQTVYNMTLKIQSCRISNWYCAQ